MSPLVDGGETTLKKGARADHLPRTPSSKYIPSLSNILQSSSQIAFHGSSWTPNLFIWSLPFSRHRAPFPRPDSGPPIALLTTAPPSHHLTVRTNSLCTCVGGCLCIPQENIPYPPKAHLPAARPPTSSVRSVAGMDLGDRHGTCTCIDRYIDIRLMYLPLH